MARVITQSLEGNVSYALALLDQFVEACPEELWSKQFGGWPV